MKVIISPLSHSLCGRPCKANILSLELGGKFGEIILEIISDQHKCVGGSMGVLGLRLDFGLGLGLGLGVRVWVDQANVHKSSTPMRASPRHHQVQGVRWELLCATKVKGKAVPENKKT